MSIENELQNALEIFSSRDQEKGYGLTYQKTGKILEQFFPNGIELKTEMDFDRFSNFVFCVGKLNRYSESFGKGGHQDSADDLMCYAAMLAEFTDEVSDADFLHGADKDSNEFDDELQF